MDDQQLIAWALRETPLILAGAFGGDPGSAIAVAVVAMSEPCLELVVTSDDNGARFTRHLLDALGRDDVAVTPGLVIAGPRYWAADGLSATETAVPEADLYGAIAAMCRKQSPFPLRYLGIGPMSDLAQLLITDSGHREPLGLASRLRIVQAGGALHTVDPRGAELRFRRDPGAVREVVTRAEHFTLVPTDFTRSPTTFGRGSRLYRTLAGVDRPWAGLLRAHCDQWFTKYGRDASLVDVLAVAAMSRRHVDFRTDDIRLDDDGRIAWGSGHRMRVATKVHFPEFEDWVIATLSSGIPARRSCWEVALDTLRRQTLISTPPPSTQDAAHLRVGSAHAGEGSWPHR
ncbi:nucleoside hydrolase [Nocardia goodfellowii]